LPRSQAAAIGIPGIASHDLRRTCAKLCRAGGGGPERGGGRPIAFAQTPIEQVRQYSKDMAVMLQWFERVSYSADIAGLEREFGRSHEAPQLGTPPRATKFALK
jgi:hypothetical protein